LLFLFALLLAGCATSYQLQGFTGGYSGFLAAPDETTITFRGNGYTDPFRVGEMATLRWRRCDAPARVPLLHHYELCQHVG
jgi:hypothetical protein